MRGLYLGGPVDASGERLGDELTTRAVVVGMTGSGRTGLAIVLVEELLGADIPCRVIDPQGDMANLLPTFPELRPEDFAPWVDPAEGRRERRTIDDLPSTTPARWREELPRRRLDGATIAALRLRADLTVLTPGPTAGTPLAVAGPWDPPETDLDDEAISDEVERLVSGVLDLVGIEADPLASREHVLLSRIVHDAWAAGETVEAPSLVRRVERPRSVASACSASTPTTRRPIAVGSPCGSTPSWPPPASLPGSRAVPCGSRSSCGIRMVDRGPPSFISPTSPTRSGASSSPPSSPASSPGRGPDRGTRPAVSPSSSTRRSVSLRRRRVPR